MKGVKRAASVHASRTWTCPCGKVCKGNGGQSSHKKACAHYERAKYVRIGSCLLRGIYDGLPHHKRQYETEFERLRLKLRGEVA